MRKERMNDKGFSLVELIIVIAIMAILIVVLAPQYLKYVERSRNSTDLQNATTMKTAVETYAADPQAANPFKSGDKFVIEVRSDKTQVTGAASAKALAALNDASLLIQPADIKCSSRTKWSQYDIKGEVRIDGGIDWSYESDPAGTFEASMKGVS